MPLDLNDVDYNWEQAFSVAANPASYTIDPKKDIEEVIASIDGENDGPQWQAVVKLKKKPKWKGNRYAWISSGCDYSGWVCQAAGSIMMAKTLELLFNPYLMDRQIREDFVPILKEKLGEHYWTYLMI